MKITFQCDRNKSSLNISGQAPVGAVISASAYLLAVVNGCAPDKEGFFMSFAKIALMDSQQSIKTIFDVTGEKQFRECCFELLVEDNKESEKADIQFLPVHDDVMPGNLEMLVGALSILKMIHKKTNLPLDEILYQMYGFYTEIVPQYQKEFNSLFAEIA